VLLSAQTALDVLQHRALPVGPVAVGPIGRLWSIQYILALMDDVAGKAA
jgi:hypothetical protein